MGFIIHQSIDQSKDSRAGELLPSTRRDWKSSYVCLSIELQMDQFGLAWAPATYEQALYAGPTRGYSGQALG